MSADAPSIAGYTAFDRHRLLSAGPLAETALAVARAQRAGRPGPFLVFDDRTGRVVDLDLRGSDDQIVARLRTHPATLRPADPPPGEGTGAPATPDSGKRGRGRPRLGVVAREVTLLPRHWDWLETRPGGASATLRRLVDEARRASGATDQRREEHEAAYRFMTAIAGDLPGYEAALRALFAHDRDAFAERTAGWPAGLRSYAMQLAFPDVR